MRAANICLIIATIAGVLAVAPAESFAQSNSEYTRPPMGRERGAGNRTRAHKIPDRLASSQHNPALDKGTASAQWLTEIGVPGITSADVNAIYIDGDSVYVGGSFSFA